MVTALDTEITRAEEAFKEYTIRMKQKIFMLEVEVSEEIALLQKDIREKIHNQN